MTKSCLLFVSFFCNRIVMILETLCMIQWPYVKKAFKLSKFGGNKAKSNSKYVIIVLRYLTPSQGSRIVTGGLFSERKPAICRLKQPLRAVHKNRGRQLKDYRRKDISDLHTITRSPQEQNYSNNKNKKNIYFKMEADFVDVSEVRKSFQHFTWIDYSVFVFMLAICTGIGLYFGCVQKQKSTQDYLMGGRHMNIVPVTFSLVAR